MLICAASAVLLRAFILPSARLARFLGLAVPVARVRAAGFRAALDARPRGSATADYVHALGSLCALLLVVALSAGVLSALLHGQGETTRRVARLSRCSSSARSSTSAARSSISTRRPG